MPGMLDPLDWDPDPQAESAEPPVSTSHKSSRLCRTADWDFILPSFVFLFCLTFFFFPSSG